MSSQQRRHLSNSNSPNTVLLPLAEDNVRYPSRMAILPHQLPIPTADILKKISPNQLQQQHQQHSLRSDHPQPACSPLQIGRNAAVNSPHMSPIDMSRNRDRDGYVAEPSIRRDQIVADVEWDLRCTSHSSRSQMQMRHSSSVHEQSEAINTTKSTRKQPATAAADDEQLESSFNAILSKSLSPKVATHSPEPRSHLDDTLSVANILDENGLAHLGEIFEREEVREKERERVSFYQFEFTL